MPCIPIFSIAALAASLFPQEFSPDAVLLRTPDISAERVVFRYAGDLWTVPREGGTATRLTSAQGLEDRPSFSPDGSQVAFVADYDGGRDIYVVGADGGTPRRVTFHPGRETLAGWDPSGESLLYFSSEASGIARAPRIFRISVDGGTPEPLPVPYGTFAAIDATGSWLAYTPNSRENRTWRRYRGGMAQDIWLFHLESGESRRVTDDPGTDRMPMWNGSKLIFQSDRGDAGIANLFEYDPESGDTRALTSLATSGARFPSIGPKDIVFEQSGGLFRFDLESEEIVRIPVAIPGDRAQLRPVLRDLSDAITAWTPSRTGKRLAVEARGEIFSVPVEKGATRNLTRSSGIAERAPSLSPDGRWVAYWSDRSGEYELTLKRADGSTFEGADESGERRLTATRKDWKRRVDWSPDSSMVAWSNHDGSLRVLAIDEGPDTEPRRFFDARYPGYLQMSWSPDSSWITWSTTAEESELDAIYLYNVKADTTHRVTSALFDDSEPVFSRDGKWLFFHSARAFSPTYADLDDTWIYEGSRQLMAVALNESVEIPWAPQNVEEDLKEQSADEASDDPDESEEPVESEDETSPATAVEIDIAGFEDRIHALDVAPGIAGALVGLENAVLFTRVDDKGEATLYRFELSGEDGNEPEAVISPLDRYALTADGKTLVVEADDKVAAVAPEPGQTFEKVISFEGVRGRFDPRAEWPQMIRDIHRMYRDWFYDEGLHGVDWDGLRDRMLSALEDANSREDVHFLIGEMLSELNVGHAYNRSPPGGFGNAENVAPAGLLGADLKPVEGGFEIVRVLGAPGEIDGRGPLHGKASAGDVLTHIDGAPADPTRSIHEHMLGSVGRTTLLTIKSPADDEARDIAVQPVRSERSLRYRDWVAAKRAYVHNASAGRIGYIHVPSTSRGGQTELYRQFLAERSRDALIVDERWNSGGQIPTRFIELLARKPTNAWAMRDGKTFAWPGLAHDGPKAMLINHSAGSGGDAFPWYFRAQGLGPLIGTRTWGGLVGIGGNPALVDGASPSVPTFGFFELDGTWGVEGHGVDPDIEVLDDPAEMTGGQDPQLERALVELESAMADWKYARPERPGSPNRTGAGIPESDR